jgi:hypothetical protein
MSRQTFLPRALACVIASLFSTVAVAQSTYWARSYHHPWRDLRGQAAHLVSDGDFIVVGGVDDSLMHQLGSRIYLPGHYLVTKTDPHGTVKWQTAWPDPKYWAVLARDVVEVEGGFIVAGFRIINGKGQWTTPVVKLSGRGSIVWQFELSHPELSYSTSAMAESEAGVILVGSSWPIISTSGLSFDVWAAEVRADTGAVLWLRTYDLGHSEEATAVTRGPDGDYVITGNVESAGKALGTFALAIESNGAIKALRSWGFSSGNASFDSVAMASDGTYIFGGSLKPVTSSYFAPESDLLAMKATLGGPKLYEWASSYRVLGGSFPWSYGHAITELPGRDIALAGSHTIGVIWVPGMGFGGPTASPFYLENAVLLKLRRDGSRLWAHSYGGSDSDGFNSIDSIELPSGGPAMLVAGTTESFPPFATPPGVAGERIWVMNLDPDGMTQEDMSCFFHPVDTSIGIVPVTDLKLTAKEKEAPYEIQQLSADTKEIRTNTVLPCP